MLDWVTNHFHPLLEQWLPSHLPYTPKIFIDRNIETGSAWPSTLKQALKTSRCLVAVWSPEYFRSSWCLAEWRSMYEREKLIRKQAARKTLKLIYPVVFSDGEYFHKDAKNTQSKDLRKWNTPHAVFSQSTEYIVFDKIVQALCKELSGIIQRVPTWQKNWPIVTPSSTQKVAVKLPRIK